MTPRKKVKKAKECKYKKRLYNEDDTMTGVGARIFNEICEVLYPIYDKYLPNYDKHDIDSLSIHATLKGLGWGYMLHKNKGILDNEEEK